jgi:hypothetical protein
MAQEAAPLLDVAVPTTHPIPLDGLSVDEISHFDELVRAGRIIAILAWADRMASANADFAPVSKHIDFLCKTLNLRGLMELSDSLRSNPASIG